MKKLIKYYLNNFNNKINSFHQGMIFLILDLYLLQLLRDKNNLLGYFLIKIITINN
jgi:hypothetical protein